MATPPNTLGSSEQPPLSKLQISNKTSLTQYGSIKFDRANYLLWETMIMPVIKGHKLDNYVLGTKLCPPEFLPGTTPGSTVKISNPDYEEWISYDQLLLGWLYSTMNPDIAFQLMKKSTSKELWDAAKELSDAHTKSRVIYYKGELQKTRKVGMKMEEYLNTIKAFFDNLALAVSPISLLDLITQILSGLDVEYTPIVVQLSDKESLSWIELQTTLLTFESRLEQLNTCQNGGINLSQTTAHIAINRSKNRSSNFSYGKGQNRPPNNNNSRGSIGRFRGIRGRNHHQISSTASSSSQGSTSISPRELSRDFAIVDSSNSESMQSSIQAENDEQQVEPTVEAGDTNTQQTGNDT
ncbi:hypothetical protein LWI28_004799 [Acer negundo]|uniref:Gag protein n=1 Tax=Acer negundo TaxID=4023 RepID=A0AAD5J3S2_ACENE|nr:hypothetical protein LWI28_004799 [Acer negundo]